MIEFTKIDIEGFCSIGKLELPLNSKGTTIIRGANGEGKSSIFSALVWVIYGKNIKGNPDVNLKPKFRGKSYKGTKVELYFNKDNHIYQIIRCLKYKELVGEASGASRLIYLVDGSEIDSKGKRTIQETIIKDIGMSYNLFLNSIMFGQGLKRLIQEPGITQRDLFEEIFELSYLTKANNIAKDKFREADIKYNDITRDINHLNVTKDTLQESQEVILDKKSKYDKDKKEEIFQIRTKLRALKDKKKSMGEVDESQLEKLSRDSKEVYKKIQSEKDIISQAKKDLGIPLEQLVDKIIKLLRNKNYDASLRELMDLKKAFNIQATSTDRLLELQEKSSALSKKTYELKSRISLYNQLGDSIDEYKDRLRKKKLEKPDFDSIYDNNLKKINKISEDIGCYEVLQKGYKEDRDLYQWAYSDPFGNSGIKAYLFESCLGELNHILNTYSEILGFNIYFDVNLESARKEFKTIIMLDGQEMTFDDLSGGQKQLASLAMIFSMNVMVAQAHGINIAFLDEIFESLSSDNIEIVVELIKKIYQQDKVLFLITHQESLPISNAKIIRVKRVNGISRYEM